VYRSKLLTRFDRAGSPRPHAGDGLFRGHSPVEEVTREQRAGSTEAPATVDGHPLPISGGSADGSDTPHELFQRGWRKVCHGQMDLGETVSRQADRVMRPLVEIHQE
jgi:hypothetical protein